MLKPYRVFTWVGTLVALSWLSLAFLDPEPPGRDTTIGVGYFLGSFFAHATLAAAWTAFGPGPLSLRGPLSFVWVLMLPAALGINIRVHGGPDEAAMKWGACLLGQWLLLQVPFWGLALGLGLRLRHIDEVEQVSNRGQLRFGIRHLFIVMFIVAVVLGIGRIIVPMISISGQAGAFLAFLALTGIVVTLPLLLGCLMQRQVILGVVLSLLLIGVQPDFNCP